MNTKLLPETIFIVVGVIAVIVAICSLVTAMHLIHKRKSNTNQNINNNDENEDENEPFIEVPPSPVERVPLQTLNRITTHPVEHHSTNEKPPLVQNQPTIKRSVTFVSFGFSGDSGMTTTPDNFTLDEEGSKQSPRIVEIDDSENQTDEKINETIEKIAMEAETESQKKKRKKHKKDKAQKNLELKKDDVVVFTDETSPKNILEVDTNITEEENVLEVDTNITEEENKNDEKGVNYVD